MNASDQPRGPAFRALQVAFDHHGDQKDKQGRDYVPGHVWPISMSVKHFGESEEVVALLHDVVEDTDFTLKEVEDQFGSEIASAVDALTKRPVESYSEMIHRVLVNPLALTVKLADNGWNIISAPALLKIEPENTLLRDRYLPTRDLLVSEWLALGRTLTEYEGIVRKLEIHLEHIEELEEQEAE